MANLQNNRLCLSCLLSSFPELLSKEASLPQKLILLKSVSTCLLPCPMANSESSFYLTHYYHLTELVACSFRKQFFKGFPGYCTLLASLLPLWVFLPPHLLTWLPPSYLSRPQTCFPPALPTSGLVLLSSAALFVAVPASLALHTSCMPLVPSSDPSPELRLQRAPRTHPLPWCFKGISILLFEFALALTYLTYSTQNLFNFFSWLI